MVPSQSLTTTDPDEPHGIVGLTNEEASYVYNVEMLGLPSKKAAMLSGMPINSVSKPIIAQARAMLRKQIRGDMAITKDDIIHGMMEAVGRAKLFGEPSTEIIGLKEVARLMGFDQPQKIDINVKTTIEVMMQQARGMPLEELMAGIPGAGEVIDAEFYETKKTENQ